MFVLYKLWFRFAKKRILGARSGYDYGGDISGHQFSFFMMFGIPAVILWPEFYFMLSKKIYAVTQSTWAWKMFSWFNLYRSTAGFQPPWDGWFWIILILAVILAGHLLVRFVACAMQETVHLLDLPVHLRGRKVFYTARALDGTERSSNKNAVSYSAGGGNDKSFLKVNGDRTFWLCQSCAFASGWIKTKRESNTVDSETNQERFPGKINHRKGDTEETECYKMAKFMEKSGRIQANKENTEKCKFLNHLVNQTPTEKLTKKIKFLIWLTAPMWLFHLLFDRRISVINPYIYRDWEALNIYRGGFFQGRGNDVGPASLDAFIGGMGSIVLASFYVWNFVVLYVLLS